jgi:acyl dehydratase
VPIDRKHLGVVSEPRVVDVERGYLRFFAHATGETNPIYTDDAAARAAGYPGVLAPPTYLFSLFNGAPARRGNIFDADGGLGVDMARVRHGEQSFTYHKPIYAGDRLTLTTTTSDIYEKRDGALEFIVQDTQAHNAAGELCVKMSAVTVIVND